MTLEHTTRLQGSRYYVRDSHRRGGKAGSGRNEEANHEGLNATAFNSSRSSCFMSVAGLRSGSPKGKPGHGRAKRIPAFRVRPIILQL